MKNEKGKFYYLDRVSGKMMTEKEMKEKKKKEREEAEAKEREAAAARGETIDDDREEDGGDAGGDGTGEQAVAGDLDDISLLEHLKFSPEEWEEARSQSTCVAEAIGDTGWSQYEQETEDEIRVFFYREGEEGKE